MKTGTLREILLARAIEEADPAGRLVPWSERERAARDALRSAGLGTDELVRDPSDRRVLTALRERSVRLIEPLHSRHPVLGDLLARSGWPRWVGIALLVAAFVCGVGLSAMNESRRINILAWPFLGLLAWNLGIYAWVVFGGVRSLSGGVASTVRLAGSAVRGVGRRLGPVLARTAQVDTLLAQALRRFVVDWSRVGAPVLAQQLRLWLHLAAASLAIGLVAGLYERGIGYAYVAGWESTWLGVRQVHWLIHTVFGPAASWAGVTLPSNLDEVAALQFQPDGTGGRSAAPWIHLIGVSLLATIVIPRLLLAGTAGFLAWRLGRASKLPAELHEYARSALGAGGQGLPVSIAVIPYAWQPEPAVEARIDALLKMRNGRAARPLLKQPLAYGDEDAAPDRLAAGRDGCVVLMSLASTPETENHGRVLDAARTAATREEGGRCRLVVDEAPYTARFGSDPGLAGRIEERRRLWREFAAGHGVEIDFLAGTT